MSPMIEKFTYQWSQTIDYTSTADPISGKSHRYFPFDSAGFDQTFESRPLLEVSGVKVTNRVDGFVLDCASVSARRSADGAIKLRFALSRNPLTQLFAVATGGASVIFGLLILQSKNTGALSNAALSAFFSMWSVRTILSSQMRVFPTLFDVTILAASMALLLAVLWRVLLEPARSPGTPKHPRQSR